jgi:hypothetical protein
MRIVWPAIALALSLTACGGGSDAPPEIPQAPVPTAIALKFYPAVVSTSFEAGTSSTINVTASAIASADFSGAPDVYGQLLDDSGVILPTAKVIPSSSLQYSLIMQTSPSLAVGKYNGKFTVKLCRDAGCSAQFPGSPMQLPYEFQVVAPKTMLGVTSVAPLVASANVGAGAPAQATVDIKAGSAWTAASDASWIKLSATSGGGDGAITLSYDTGTLGAGNYIATLTVSSADGQRAMLPVTLQMLPSAFVVDSTGFIFSAINGAPIAPQTVKLALDTGVVYNWSASTDAAWLSADPAAGSTPAQTTLLVNPAKGPLASGTHNASITLSSVAATPRKIPVQLQLTKPTLTMSTNSITLGGPAGRLYLPQTLSLNINTGTYTWPWEIVGTLPEWVSATGSGMVGQAGADVVFSPNPASVSVGTQTAVLNATVHVNGDTLSAPLALTINRDRLKILPSLTAVALVSTPGWANLTRTVTVNDNFDLGAAWTASSNQSWLRLAVSGKQLTLSADPAMLPQNETSYATVTLNTTVNGATTPESIRVAIWKGSASPSAMSRIATTYRQLIADPLRPLLYVHNGAGSIDVYNFYTAQKTATISGLGTALGEMTTSPNGDRLYVYDTSNSNVVVVNLSSLTKENSWPLGYFIDTSTHLLAIRPNGVEMIMMGNGDVISPDTGKVMGNTGILNGTFAASADGKNVYVRNTALRYFSVDYSELGGGTVLASQNTSLADGGYNSRADLAVKPDGSAIYMAGYGLSCARYNPLTLRNTGDYRAGGGPTTSAIKVDINTRVYCGIASPYAPDADIWVYPASGLGITKYKISAQLGSTGLLDRQMAVSADGMFVAGLTNDPFLGIIPVGP